MEQATRGAHRSRVTDVRLFSNLHPLLIARFLSFCVSAAHRISIFGGSVTNLVRCRLCVRPCRWVSAWGSAAWPGTWAFTRTAQWRYGRCSFSP